LKGALHYPFREDPTTHGLNALRDFVTAYPPPKPSAIDERHKHKTRREGLGVHHLAFWHTISHERAAVYKDNRSKGAVLSSQVVKVPTYRLNAVTTFFREFTPITQVVGALFDVVDHQNYQRYSKLFHRMADNSAAIMI
jgi:hypothetical protein